jgi:biotin transport system substrate-specific component
MENLYNLRYMENKTLNQITKSAIFVALLAIGGIISISVPMIRTPFSLQVFFVLLTSLVLGPFYGSISVFVYILLGVIGIPIFAGMRSGPAVLFGPTGGFLLGFLISVPFIAFLSKKLHLLSLLLGLLVIYFFGSLQYAFVAKVSFGKSLLVAVLPFIPLDCFKALLAYEIYSKLKILKQI